MLPPATPSTPATAMSSSHGSLDPVTRDMIKSLKKFSGAAGHDLVGFLGRVRSLARGCQVPVANQGVMLLSCLEGGALDYCLTHASEFSVARIEDLLRSRYTMPNEQLFWRQEALRIRQEGTVEEYFDRFIEVANRISSNHQLELAHYFVSNLKDDVRRAVWRLNITCLDDALQAALTYDRGNMAADFLPHPQSSNVPSLEHAFERMQIDAVANPVATHKTTSPPTTTPPGFDEQAVAAVMPRRGSGIQCHYCKNWGHAIRHCRKLQALRKRQQGRGANTTSSGVNNVNEDQVMFYSIPASQDLFILHVTYCGNHIPVLVDSGASRNFILCETVGSLNMKTSSCKPFPIKFAGNEQQTIKEKVILRCKFGEETINVDFYIFSGQNNRFKMILGMPWFTMLNPRIDWKQRTIHLKNGTIIHAATQSMEPFDGKEPIDNVYWLSATQTAQDTSTPSAELPREVAEILHEYKDVAYGPLEHGPPQNRIFQHKIDTGDAEPVAIPPRKMSPKELTEVEATIKDLTDKGFIRPSMSPWCSPVLFVRKKDGSLRMCIDYRSLNRVTKKAKYPIPRVDETLERIGKNKFFSTLDLKSGYHQIAMEESAIEKTAFGSRFGQFEYRVMPFGLCNAPATFMAEMNAMFKGDSHVVVYMDDILIMSKTKEEHLAHLRQVLFSLQEKKFRVNLKKCAFLQTSVEFLGHLVTPAGIQPTPSRVACIKHWPTPTDARDLRSFLGLANYYRTFIPRFSELAEKLWALTSTNNEFIWTDSHDKDFERLKHAFTTSLILAYPDPEKPYIIETDASNKAIGGVLLQENDEGKERPVAFESHKLSESQKNLSAYELELAGLVHNLRKFRCHVEGTDFKVRTDHKALISLFNDRSGKCPPSPLNKYLNEIALYQPFQIEYKAGKVNIPADILSRRMESEHIMTINEVSTERRTIIENIHSKIGHLGMKETMAQVKVRHQWKNLARDVEEVVKQCPVCQVHCHERGQHLKLQPLPTVGLFKRWGIDVMGPFRETVSRKQYVILAIDHFSRWVVAKAVPSPTAEETVRFIQEEIVYHYGVPEELVSDQGTNFTSQYMQQFASRLGIFLKRTTPYHPQTNGATERANQLFKQILSKLVHNHGVRFWDELVARTVWNMRARTHSTTGFSPFEILYSQSPRILPGDQVRTVNSSLSRTTAMNNWEEARQKMLLRPDCQQENTTIHSQDYVLVKRHQRQALDPRWEGPFPVLNVRGKTAKILLSNGTQSWQSFDNLKKYQQSERRVM
jgi:transposase InsO family protein